MLSPKLFNIRRTRFHKSSPVQPISDFRGGSTRVREDKRTDEWKSLCLILDFLAQDFKIKFLTAKENKLLKCLTVRDKVEPVQSSFKDILTI